jgi:hypothetical protein
MMTKFGKWSLRDLYRLPVVYLIFWPLVARNYALRAEGKLPDEWYWADTICLHWGYAVRS